MQLHLNMNFCLVETFECISRCALKGGPISLFGCHEHESGSIFIAIYVDLCIPVVNENPSTGINSDSKRFAILNAKRGVSQPMKQSDI